jgi:hypothetical protein
MTALARVEHVRAAGYCMRGVRRWLQGREYGWRDLIERGIPTDWLRATGDAMAIAVADIAEGKR